MMLKFRRRWWHLTHTSQQSPHSITYVGVDGSAWRIGGMLLIRERRWYAIAYRIFWGQRRRSVLW